LVAQASFSRAVAHLTGPIHFGAQPPSTARRGRSDCAGGQWPPTTARAATIRCPGSRRDRAPSISANCRNSHPAGSHWRRPGASLHRRRLPGYSG
jgi:hypothetical protein